MPGIEQSSSDNVITFPNIPQGEAKPLQQTLLAIEALGFKPEPINAAFFAENENVLHALVRTNGNPQGLFGVFTLQLRKMIPASEYSAGRTEPSPLTKNNSSQPETATSPLEALSATGSFEEAVKLVEHKGYLRFPIGAQFYKGDDGRVHAFVTADEDPGSLIGVFRLDFNKIITPDKYFAFSPNLQRELITTNNPYADGQHP